MAHKISIIGGQTVPQLLWNEFQGNPFNEENITKIKDNVGNKEVPVTSIPSPFAQMHLFDTAFKFLNEEYKRVSAEKGDLKSVLNGNSTYHRIVSNCLDVYELMYSYQILGLNQKIKLSAWLASILDEFAVASFSGLKTFASTVKTYINNYNNDRKRFENVSPFNQLLLIYYEDRLIAGTSPLTGFFTLGDQLPHDIRKHDSSYFFADKKPLYERDRDFQAYLNYFFESNAQATKAFNSVHQYIRNCRNHITNSDLSRIVKKTETNLSNLTDEERPKFEILNINNQPVYLLGHSLQYGCKPTGDFKSELKDSDYAVDTSRTVKKLVNPPLALIKGSKKMHWKYFKGAMPENIEPDTLIGTDFDKRKIPVFNLEYPCFGKNDFLSRHLIQLADYNVNIDKFWMVDNKECHNILPPIKPAYFNYFTIEDLKKNLTIERLPSKAVSVKLKIPVKGDGKTGIVEYERVYTQGKPENIDSDSKGALITARIGLGIYPFFRVSDNRYNDYYKIAQFYDDSIDSLNCTFYRENKTEPTVTLITRNHEFDRTRKEEGLVYISKYTELATYTNNPSRKKYAGTTDDIRFDVIGIQITVKNALAEGVIIPDWGDEIKLQGTGSIAFDIGTSNTHVAYAIESGAPQSLISFGGTKNLPELVFLHQPNTEERDSARYDYGVPFGIPQLTEFMPAIIGENSTYKFPIRTIINQDNDTDATDIEDLSFLVNINVPFGFGIQTMRDDHDKTFSHLKWGTSDPSRTDVRNRLQIFIEQLALMGRNKLLQEKVKPDKINVIWFKPLSMGIEQSSVFNAVWDEVYKKYFVGTGQKQALLYSITESWAPYFSHSRTYGSGKMYLNVDIGGGTTDILVFRDGKPLLTTSFRFAGDNLYDDGLNLQQLKDNGILQKYERDGRAIYKGKATNLNIVNYIAKQSNLRSSDLMMYFLTQKEMVDKLKLDTDMQLIFLLHHAALFYHTAQVLKIYNCEMPERIGLSGNGSKLLEITNRDQNINRPNGIRNLVELIFKKVYELKTKPDIEIEIKQNPKNSTAEGGIRGLPAIMDNPYADVNVYYIALGDKQKLISGSNGQQKRAFKYTSFLEDGNNTIPGVAENVTEFLEFFFEELWYDCGFIGNFGLNKSFNQEKIKAHCINNKNILSALREGVQIKRDFEKEPELNETMFFYPIRALMYELSKELSDVNGSDKFKSPK